MFKKIIAAAVTIMTAAVIGSVSASAAVSLGDVDNSGVIDIEDAVIIINHINGVESISSSAMTVADVDLSGNVDIEDAVAIINHINGVSSIENGRMLDALHEKYSGNYCLKTEHGELPFMTYETHVKGNNYYIAIRFYDEITQFHVGAVNGIAYYISVGAFYTEKPLSYPPKIMNYIDGYPDKYIKTVTDGDIISEYYTTQDGVYDGGGEIVYNFDRKTSALKSFRLKPYDTSNYSDMYHIVTYIGTADTSKFSVPDLEGYKKRE